jgi:hypothetical protein
VDAHPDAENLPYLIELWGAHDNRVERVLARAARISLARAIFKAADEEYPNRRLTLRRGERIISDNRRG